MLTGLLCRLIVLSMSPIVCVICYEGMSVAVGQTGPIPVRNVLILLGLEALFIGVTIYSGRVNRSRFPKVFIPLSNNLIRFICSSVRHFPTLWKKVRRRLSPLLAIMIPSTMFPWAPGTLTPPMWVRMAVMLLI